MPQSTEKLEPLKCIKTLLEEKYPECRIECKSDGSFAEVWPPLGDEIMHIAVFIHKPAHSITSAYRYKSDMEIPSNDKIHYWISIQNKDQQTLYYKVTCCLESLMLFINNWLTPRPA